jgi:bacterioferritin-associated ferredoxin
VEYVFIASRYPFFIKDASLAREQRVECGNLHATAGKAVEAQRRNRYNRNRSACRSTNSDHKNDESDNPTLADGANKKAIAAGLRLVQRVRRRQGCGSLCACRRQANASEVNVRARTPRCDCDSDDCGSAAARSPFRTVRSSSPFGTPNGPPRVQTGARLGVGSQRVQASAQPRRTFPSTATSEHIADRGIGRVVVAASATSPRSDGGRPAGFAGGG